MELEAITNAEHTVGRFGYPIGTKEKFIAKLVYWFHEY